MFLRDQPYGVVIEPLIRGSVDAVRQHCPAKRLTPMGLVADEVARKWCDFRRKYGSRKQEMVQNSYLTDTQWVLLVSSLGCIIENGQKMERKGGSSVTKSFDKR